MGGDTHSSTTSRPPEDLKQINFSRGWPNRSLLPTSQIRTATQAALSNPSIWEIGLNYGCEPMIGFTPLREEIAKWLCSFYQHTTSESISSLTSASTTPSSEVDSKPGANRISITGGASQNLACVLQVYSDPLVTTVWMVAPCYFLACDIFRDAGLRLKAVPEVNGDDGEDDGIDLEWLERGLKESEGKWEGAKPQKYEKPWGKYYKNIIYCVPTFSNPSGKTMSLPTRQALIRLARRYDALIITDDVYDQLQWSITPNKSANHSQAAVARLVDIDRTMEPIPTSNSFGNTMSNGSFSKIVAPGIRTGWAEGTPKFIYGLGQCGSTASGGAPSHMTATFVYEMLRSGSLQAYISEVLCPSYQRRYLILLDAIQKCLLPLGAKIGNTAYGEEKLFGGYFVWLRLPDSVDGGLVTKEAALKWNLVLSPGNLFEVIGDNEDDKVRFRREVRLSFAWVEEQDLIEGVRRLRDVIINVMGR